jgi:hypothetical protein
MRGMKSNTQQRRYACMACAALNTERINVRSKQRLGYPVTLSHTEVQERD